MNGFKKFFLYASFPILAVMFFSCSDVSDDDSSVEETLVQNKQGAYIKITLDDSARTVLPSAPETGFTNLVLKGAKSGETEKLLGSWENDSKMQNATIALVSGSWSFSLSAKAGDSECSGTITKEITEGENTLAFSLEISDSGNGEGSFSITVNYAEVENAEKISYAVATIEHMDKTDVEGFEPQTLVPSENSVTFTSSGIKAGPYRAKIKFYASTEKDGDFELATYREIVRISSDLTSTATRTIENFDDIYTITYVLNGGTNPDDAIIHYDDKTNVILPVPTKEGSVFLGWYETNVCSGNTISGWNADERYGNTIVYAKWDIIGVSSENIVEKIKNLTYSCTLRATGNFTTDLIREINAAMKELFSKRSDILVSLDFSTITGITELEEASSTNPSYSFYGCTNLSGIILPDSVTSIGNYAFSGCTKLVGIAIPDSVTSVGKRTFCDCKTLTSITIPDSVTSIGVGTFSGCSSLEEISIPFVGDRSYGSGCSSTNGTFGYIFGSGSYSGGEATEQYYGASYPSITYYIPSTLKKVTVTGGSILYGAFYGCSNLTSITIGDGVTSIESYAFSGCSSLEELTVPFVGNSVSASSEKSLFGYVFGENSYSGGKATTQKYASSCSLTYYIPSSLKNVIVTGGNLFYGAFYGCTSLTSI
ncbi:MAG TPA: hypothetical protein DCO72_09080, partial [Ruminococcus sp.]|nr:hypothetical protein [Ruminococcus sp.]